MMKNKFYIGWLVVFVLIAFVSEHNVSAQSGGFVFQPPIDDITINVTSGGVSGNIDSHVVLNVAPRYTGWNLDFRIKALLQSSAKSVITYNTPTGSVNLPVRYIPDASDQAMSFYTPTQQYEQGLPIPVNDSVVLNNPIDTVEERNNLNMLTVLTGPPSNMNDLINSLNSYVNSNPPLVETLEIIDKYQLVSPDPSNAWYCEGTGMSNGSHTLNGSYNVSYSFQPGITYKLLIYERIWAADRQAGLNSYGYHDCLAPLSADYRLRYDGVIVTGGGLCPNGFIDPGEECDDGNMIDNDSCSNACTIVNNPAPEPNPTVGPGDDIYVKVTGINQCGNHNENVCVLQAVVESNKTNAKYVLFRDGDGNLIGKGTNISGENGTSELVLEDCLTSNTDGSAKTHNITAIPYMVF